MSTGNLNTNSQSSKKNIRFEHDLIDAIEAHKDPLIPFAAWVKQACREKLEREQSAQVTPSKPKAEHVRPVVSSDAQPKYEQVRPVALSGVQTANEKRALEIQQQIQAAIDALTPQDRARIANHRTPKSEFRKSMSEPCSRDSIAKYWDMIEPKLNTV